MIGASLGYLAGSQLGLIPYSVALILANIIFITAFIVAVKRTELSDLEGEIFLGTISLCSGFIIFALGYGVSWFVAILVTIPFFIFIVMASELRSLLAEKERPYVRVESDQDTVEGSLIDVEDERIKVLIGEKTVRFIEKSDIVEIEYDAQDNE